MCYVIPILSPFLFIQSLCASFQDFIYFSPLIFIHTQYIFSVNGCIEYQVLESEVVIEKSAQDHFGDSSHGNTEIIFAFMHCVVYMFEK